MGTFSECIECGTSFTGPSGFCGSCAARYGVRHWCTQRVRNHLGRGNALAVDLMEMAYRKGVESTVGLVLSHRVSELPGERPYINRCMERVAEEIKAKAARIGQNSPGEK